MRLVSFDGGFGRIEGDAVVPMGDDVVAFLETGRVTQRDPIQLDSLALRAPVPRPGKVICVGLNYRDHAEETGQVIPDEPVLFAKFANSVIGPGAAIDVPAFVQQPDFEAELGVVIGRTATNVEPAEALDHVAGYTCCNDVSARDLQFRSSQWLLGKAIDGFLPVGPWILTPDEVGDPQTLGIRCLVNGDVVQDSSTKQMVFGVAELVAFISRTITLEPGDLIATGTPPGVGMARTPPRWLRDGDTMTVEIERIGALTNTVREVAPRGGSR
jgi:2-keto-4-pentenoate hydratase/2-oxohepta-3-ene-1,7-dioic acid hydratase in catechol pathway